MIYIYIYISLYIYSCYLQSVGEANGNPLQYSSWRNPWTKEPSRLQSMELQRVGYDWVTITHTPIKSL